MIFADKLIQLRKKAGYSQEELAEQMNVTRQAVSKWESAQTVPDLSKLLQLSRLFGVSTDYLLKEELEEEEYTGEDSESSVRKVSLSEAGDYLGLRFKAAGQIALGTLLCILSPIPLLLLAAASQGSLNAISENLAGGAGLIVLLLIVALAVVVFIRCGSESEPYAYLVKGPFECAYGVRGMALEKQKLFNETYRKYNLIGVCLCILCPIPLFIGAFLEKETLLVALLCLTLALAGIGVWFFIKAGVPREAMDRLLKEGEYAPGESRKRRLKSAVSTAYWLLATAVYLLISFLTNNWQDSWVVWPVAGVLFAGVLALCNFASDKEDKKEE